MLCKSPIKWRQRPDMTIAVDWNAKHQFKKSKSGSHFEVILKEVESATSFGFFPGASKLLRRKQKIAVFPLTRPTLSFCADPAVFIANKNKIEIFSCRLNWKTDNDLKTAIISTN